LSLILIECTFIIALTNEDHHRITDDLIIGDVNLFFNLYEESKTCEVNIMIAETSARRRGFAKEALILIMMYAMDRLNADRFYCKISKDNDSSLSLFRRLPMIVTFKI